MFGFARLHGKAYGDDNKTFPHAGPVALCQRCAQGGDDFKCAEEPESHHKANTFRKGSFHLTFYRPFASVS